MVGSDSLHFKCEMIMQKKTFVTFYVALSTSVLGSLLILLTIMRTNVSLFSSNSVND